MNPTSLIYALGSAGPFASRVFLPAFLTALLLRFGGHLPLIGHLGLLAHLGGHPTWFTSNISLIVLGALSVVEVLAQKNPEARNVLHEINVYLKTALAVLSALGVMSATDASFVQHTVQHAGFFGVAVPVISALATLRLSTARRDVMMAVFDHIDGTELDHLISWLEDAWAAFGIFLLILFPIVMLILIGLATLVLFLLRRRLESLEDRARQPCPACSAPVYACAVSCPACRKPLDHPAAIGVLGQSKPYPASDPVYQPYRLTEKRRCPACAARLKPRALFQQCPACRHALMRDPAFARGYIDFISRRLPIVLGVCFLMSLVPIIGLIAGVVYYRMELVLPFSQYLPLGRRFLLRWGIRLVFLILILFQWIPILGGLVVPLMALLSFTAYRKTFRSLALGTREHSDTSDSPIPGASAPA